MENKPIKDIMGGELYHHGIVGVYSRPNSDDYLAHYGVVGMHWGIRRFQPYSLIPRKSGKGGKETGAAKKASKSSSSSPKSPAPAPKQSRNAKSAQAKAAKEKEAKTAKQRKEELEKVVKSGDINQIYKHRKELSEKQLKDAVSRINTEKEVASLYRAANPTKLDKVVNATKKLKDINDGFENVATLYNNAARTINMLNGEDTGETMKYIKKANTGGKNPRKLKDKVKEGTANKDNKETRVTKPQHSLKKSKQKNKSN